MILASASAISDMGDEFLARALEIGVAHQRMVVHSNYSLSELEKFFACPPTPVYPITAEMQQIPIMLLYCSWRSLDRFIVHSRSMPHGMGV